MLGASLVCKGSPRRRTGRVESDGSLFREMCFVFPFSCQRGYRKDSPANTMQQAVSSDPRVLLPLPVRLSRPGKLYSELGIITSYPLSSTFSKVYVPAYYSPKSSSGAPKPRFFCGCGLRVLAVVVFPAPVSAQPLLQPRTAPSYPHLDVGCLF